MGNKIYTNHTLEEYNKKYGNKNLKKVKKLDADKNPNLLKGHSWWLIKDTYYEIPNNKGFKAWWHNLGKGGQIALCALLGCVVAAAVVVPTVIVLNQNKTVDHKAVIDPEVKDVTCTQKKLENGALEVTLNYDTTKKELADITVKIGNQTLLLNTDYTLEGNKIVIAANVLGSNKATEIVIKPILQDKQPVTPIYVTGISISAPKTEIEVDETLQFSATVEPSTATNPNVEWRLDFPKGNDEIATIDDKGLLTAKGEGDVVVCATPKDDPEGTREVSSNEIHVTINAKAQELTKDKWLAETTSLYKQFCESTLEYTVDQISDAKTGEKSGPIDHIAYSKDKTDRKFNVYFKSDKTDGQEFAGTKTTEWSKKPELFSGETEGGHFKKLGDGSLEYYTDNVPATESLFIKSLKINKYGYLTHLEYYGNGKSIFTQYITYTGDPAEPVTPVVTEIKVIDDKKKVVQEVNVIKDQSINVKILDQNDNNVSSNCFANAGEGVEASKKTDYWEIKGTQVGKNNATFSYTPDSSISVTLTVNVEESAKDKFISFADKWVKDGFCSGNNNTEYTKDDLKLTISGKEVTTGYLNYSGSGTTRKLVAGADVTTSVTVASIDFSGTSFKSKLKDDSSYYTIGGGSVSYINPNATTGEIAELSINEYGYVTCYSVIGGSNNFSCVYSNTPTEKKKFIRIFNEYKITYQNATSVYTKTEISSFTIYDEWGQSVVSGVENIETTGTGSNRKTELIDSNDVRYRIDANNSTIVLDALEDEESYYTFKDNYIEYSSTTIGASGVVKIRVNKFGYVERINDGGVNSNIEYTPNGEPNEVMEIYLDYGIAIDAFNTESIGIEAYNKSTKLDGVNYTTESDLITLSENSFTIKDSSKTGGAIIKATKKGYLDTQVDFEIGQFNVFTYKNNGFITGKGSSFSSYKTSNLIVPSRFCNNDGQLIEPIGIECNAFQADSQWRQKDFAITLPSSIKYIGASAFRTSYLTSITLNEGLEQIGYGGSTLSGFEGYSFEDCDKLLSIKIPSTVTKIHCNSFGSSDNLTEIDLTSFEDPNKLPVLDGGNLSMSSHNYKLYVKNQQMENAFKTAPNWQYSSAYFQIKNP